MNTYRIVGQLLDNLPKAVAVNTKRAEIFVGGGYFVPTSYYEFTTEGDLKPKVLFVLSKHKTEPYICARIVDEFLVVCMGYYYTDKTQIIGEENQPIIDLKKGVEIYK
jgi:hypothetical protein